MTKDVGLQLHKDFRGNWRLKGDLLSTHLLSTLCPCQLTLPQIPAGSIPGQRLRQPKLRSGLRALGGLSMSEPRLIPAQHRLARGPSTEDNRTSTWANRL